MGRFLRLTNGIPRGAEEAGGAGVTIYDSELLVVGANPQTGEILGPITTGTPITLPNSKTYTSEELEVYLNGQRLNDIIDYNYEGTAPRTQISFTFEIIVGDRIRFRIDRGE